MNLVNKPEARALSYEVVAIFIAAVTGFFVYAAFFTPMGTVGIAAAIVSAFVEVIMLLILASLYRTRYVLANKELVIETTKLVGVGKTIPLETVESVERTMIPFGIKLFGASFHGGHYHIPGLGKAFLSITNFKDGLLIRTSYGSFVITPSDPLGFKEAIESTKAK
jgi:hypothetical protein